jgi:L-asparaginase
MNAPRRPRTKPNFAGPTKEALAALDRAAKNGIIVVRSTRVMSGFVNRNVEVDDDRRGFVVSLDMNPQKARLFTQAYCERCY